MTQLEEKRIRKCKTCGKNSYGKQCTTCYHKQKYGKLSTNKRYHKKKKRIEKYDPWTILEWED